MLMYKKIVKIYRILAHMDKILIPMSVSLVHKLKLHLIVLKRRNVSERGTRNEIFYH